MHVNSARPPALVQFASRSASQALGNLRAAIPIDLFRLAHNRRVLTVEFRPLLADGCMFVRGDGFVVQICDKKTGVIHVGGTRLARRLTVKQRFTLAHEIAHTLAYDLTSTPPQLNPATVKAIDDSGGRGQGQSLEGFCQIAAGFILVPPGSFRQEGFLGPLGRVDSLDALRRLAQRFDVSPEALIHRIDNPSRDEVAHEDLKDPDFALAMVQLRRGRELVIARTCGSTFNGLLRQPKLYTSIATWIENTPILKRCKLLDVEEGEWTRPTTVGTLRIWKRRFIATPATYFLEMKHIRASA